MLWEVLPGAIVMVEAFRSDGRYVPTLPMLRNVAAPASGVTPVHVTPYISVAGAPVAVPNPALGLPKKLLNGCSGLDPVSKAYRLSKPPVPTTLLVADAGALVKVVAQETYLQKVCVPETDDVNAAPVTHKLNRQFFTDNAGVPIC